MSLKVFIVDDEPNIRALLVHKLKKYFPTLEIVGDTGDIAIAQEQIIQLQPDLLLLDVKLGGQATSFDLLQKIPIKDFEIMFITGHRDYAVDSYDVDAIDYITKPINNERFIKAIQKAVKHIEQQSLYKLPELLHNIKQMQDGKLAIPSEQGTVFIRLSNILSLEAEESYTYIQIQGQKKILSSYSLGHYIKRLQDWDYFFAISRSCIVNIHFIKNYNRRTSVLTLENDCTFVVARRRKTVLEQYLDLA